jgi:hypothetical protein
MGEYSQMNAIWRSGDLAIWRSGDLAMMPMSAP